MNEKIIRLDKKKKKIVVKIDNAIISLKKEKEKHEKGIEDFLSINIINKIVSELEKMKEKLSPNLFIPTYNHIIIDWPNYTNLGNDLLGIVDDYNKIGNLEKKINKG